MPNRTFGRGFLADKLYNTEDAVPAGAFELLQRRRKRRPLDWLLFPLALLLVGGVFLSIRAFDLPERMADGEAMRTAGRLNEVEKAISHASSLGKAGQSKMPATAGATSASPSGIPASPSVKEKVEVVSSFSESKRKALLDNGQLQTSSNKAASEGNALQSADDAEASVSSTGSMSNISETRLASNKDVASGQKREASLNRKRHTMKSGTILLASAANGYAVGQSDGEKAWIGHSTQKSQSQYPLRQQRLSPQEDINASPDEIPTATRAITKEVANRDHPPIAVDGETLENRIVGLSVAALPVSGDVAFKPFDKPKKPLISFQELHITLGAVILGQEANTQSVAGQTVYSPTNTSAGIGLDAGVSTRLGLTNWLGLLAGVHSLLYNQTATGIATDPNAKVIYTPTKTNTLEAQPVATETSYGAKTWTWIPLMPQVMAEFRLPAARWGIAAGVYAPLVPQTYASVEGSAKNVYVFAPASLVQPMAQLWADASRTRIALTVRRVQGNGLMPHPAASASTGLFVSGTMSYRLFK